MIDAWWNEKITEMAGKAAEKLDGIMLFGRTVDLSNVDHVLAMIHAGVSLDQIEKKQQYFDVQENKMKEYTAVKNTSSTAPPGPWAL